MALLVIIGVVVLLAFGVVGSLFYMLNKESHKPVEKALSEPTVPLTEMSRLEEKHAQAQAEYQKRVSTLEQELQDASQKVQNHEASQADFASKEQEYHLRAQQKEEEYLRKSQQLENELQDISQKAQIQSQEALSTIEELKQENARLKSEQNMKITSAEANLIKAEETINGLREEQGVLQTRLSESQVQVQKLQEEVVFVKQVMAKDVSLNKDEIDRLNVENQNLQRTAQNAVAQATQDLQNQVNQLTQENETLKARLEELVTSNQELTKTNHGLGEESHTLQWDLTKVRAQMTSFERACENYQTQLKAALEQSEAFEQNNVRLTEANGQMQLALEDLKKQNEDLGRREKLFETDLEKTRVQLVALQKDHESLKAKGTLE